MNYDQRRRKFVDNYIGLLNPETAWQRFLAQLKREELKKATYSKGYNAELQRRTYQI